MCIFGQTVDGDIGTHFASASNQGKCKVKTGRRVCVEHRVLAMENTGTQRPEA